jgi:hypothetical protein
LRSFEKIMVAHNPQGPEITKSLAAQQPPFTQQDTRQRGWMVRPITGPIMRPAFTVFAALFTASILSLCRASNQGWKHRPGSPDSPAGQDLAKPDSGPDSLDSLDSGAGFRPDSHLDAAKAGL